MRQSEGFVYDGISSEEMEVRQVNSSAGLYEETFMASKKINEERIRGRDTSFLYSVDYDPLSFPLELYFDEGMSDEKSYKVARWLNKQYYTPFYTLTNPERIFYCMPVDDISVIHNGIKQGYLKLTMRCNSPYTYSPYMTYEYDLSNNTSTGTEIKLENKGEETYPEIWITTKEIGDFSIVNKSDSGREMRFSNLQNGESLYIDSDNEEIESDLPLAYRYDNHNGVFFNLQYGVNRLQVYGKIQMKIRYRYKFLLGF
ncbi:phage tail domain-containing protein [Bacillus sp. UMB0728]|uniref:phage tail domain-containing protein n=1 Tax=Bacillus sp. UMB0728 TaxID=2066052 RepID=UPI000C76758D|nr:phage tail domain-containing protein [Bacillus sp. UMB0728]PLR72328.1 hypothetical protein CYJ37_12290 [Bacillus sp. UMB0728]